MVLTNVWLIQEYLDDEFNIENNDVVLDIGGHIGLFALFASQFCKKGKIFCLKRASVLISALRKAGSIESILFIQEKMTLILSF